MTPSPWILVALRSRPAAQVVATALRIELSLPVHSAATPAEAMQRVAEHPPVAAVVDPMWQHDGRSLVHHLSPLPMVLSSAEEAERAGGALRAHGVVAWFRQPVDPLKVAAAVGEAIAA